MWQRIDCNVCQCHAPIESKLQARVGCHNGRVIHNACVPHAGGSTVGSASAAQCGHEDGARRTACWHGRWMGARCQRLHKGGPDARECKVPHTLATRGPHTLQWGQRDGEGFRVHVSNEGCHATIAEDCPRVADAGMAATGSWDGSLGAPTFALCGRPRDSCGRHSVPWSVQPPPAPCPSLPIREHVLQGLPQATGPCLYVRALVKAASTFTMPRPSTR